MREPGGSIAYVPALDGLRALAVGVVLLFHAGFGWASGGFFGVSVFFTLSGYLITSLLLAEQAATGRIDLRAFFVRRFRRLLPAAYVCVALVLALGALWAGGQRRELPGDVFAAVGNVSNWRFAFTSASYADLFLGGPSPLAHFWSLAIEEQCYLLLPLVAWGCLRRGRRSFAVVLSLLMAASLVATALTGDPDLVYYGAHTRGFELLLGAGLAVAVAGRHVPRWLRTAAGVVGLAALGAATALATVADAWLYRGGLAAFAVASVGVLLGCTGPTPVARALAVRPLVAIGRVSYGLYLYHWPIFLVLSPERVGWSQWPLFALRMSVTALCAVVSARVIEQPIRQRRLLRRPLAARSTWAVAVAGLVVAGAVAVPAAPLSATEVLLTQGDDGVVQFTPVPTVAAGPVEPASPIVLVVGSNTTPIAALRSVGLTVIDGVQPGCQIAAVTAPLPLDGEVVGDSPCEPSAQRWARLAARYRPSVIVVSAGPMDSGAVVLPDASGLYLADDLSATGVRMSLAAASTSSALETLRAAEVPIVLFDPVAPEHSGSHLDELALQLGIERGVQRSVEAAVAATLEVARGRSVVAEVRVLVLGDSTSLNVARALHDGSDGRLLVTWAGANGCPFVPVSATRPTRGEWLPVACPVLVDVLPGVIAQARPDVVLLVVGPTELLQQQYPGDPSPHVVGDGAFQAAHDAQMQTVLGLLPVGVPMLVADCPPIAAGPWASPEMTDPARLAAWHAQIERWDASSEQVITWPYASVITGHEAEHGSIRSDGAHPDIDVLTQLAREQLVPMLLAAVPSRS